MSPRAVIATALALVLAPSTALAQFGASPDLPTPTRVLDMRAFPVGGAPTVGTPNAPIRIVLFTDYQCPFCATLFATIQSAIVARPGMLQVTVLNYPLDGACNPAMSGSMHPEACLRAAAATCADGQGRFAEMASQLYALGRQDSGQLAVEAAAEQLQLDLVSWNACMRSDLPAQRVVQDVGLAARVPVTGTPTMIINGYVISGAMQLDRFLRVVDHLAAGGRL